MQQTKIVCYVFKIVLFHFLDLSVLTEDAGGVVPFQTQANSATDKTTFSPTKSKKGSIESIKEALKAKLISRNGNNISIDLENDDQSYQPNDQSEHEDYEDNEVEMIEEVPILYTATLEHSYDKARPHSVDGRVLEPGEVIIDDTKNLDGTEITQSPEIPQVRMCSCHTL